MKKKKETSDEEINSDAKHRSEEKELEDQREEARKEIEKDIPVKKRGKFISFLAQLLGLAPQIIGILKDTNVIKNKK